jgi:hypothetical protein
MKKYPAVDHLLKKRAIVWPIFLADLKKSGWHRWTWMDMDDIKTPQNEVVFQIIGIAKNHFRIKT